MGVPALLVDFPPPSSPGHAAAARHLGHQWPIFWSMGNVFFRPISTLGIFGYGYAGYCAYRSGELRLIFRPNLGRKMPSSHPGIDGRLVHAKLPPPGSASTLFPPRCSEKAANPVC